MKNCEWGFGIAKKNMQKEVLHNWYLSALEVNSAFVFGARGKLKARHRECEKDMYNFQMGNTAGCEISRTVPKTEIKFIFAIFQYFSIGEFFVFARKCSVMLKKNQLQNWRSVDFSHHHKGILLDMFC